MLDIESPSLVAPISVKGGFDLDTYLQQCDQNPTFTMVEIGPGRYPVAYQQPTGFTGLREYMGVRAPLRPLSKQEKLAIEALQAEHVDENIAYIDHKLGRFVSGKSRLFFTGRNRAFYHGPYDPATDLEAGIADEVVLSDIAGDPHVGRSEKRTARLLHEVSRLVADSGFVVVRETQTPGFASRRLTNKFLDEAGLQSIARYTRLDTEWPQLEARYGNPEQVGRGSFYQFLAKAVVIR
ncbi:MAG TPA: hypothetical protein VIJ68_04545 [Candidatus Saccharimonadales bacterium]